MQTTLRQLVLSVSLLFFTSVCAAHEPDRDMLNAATAWLAALTPAQRAQATFALTDAERENWNFIPTARAGLPLKQMTAAQQELARALLRTGLSHQGAAKAEAVMSLENVLKELDRTGPTRDPLLYYVTVFGEPSATASWGWRFEGHHLSFNFTVVDGAHVFFTPSFIGSNPADVRSGPQKGLRVLGTEEDLGRAFVRSLDAAQQAIAIISPTAPREIVTGNQRRISALAPVGINGTQLNASQRERLDELLGLYLNRYRSEIASETLARIKADGMDRITFAWAGGLAPGVGHYYRIQGPTFLCEFDNTQNHANHIHTAWRDFKNDFGRDPLAEHYARDHAARSAAGEK